MKEQFEDREAAVDVSTPDVQDVCIEHDQKACLLAPMAQEPARKKVQENPTGPRASHKCCHTDDTGPAPEAAGLDWTGLDWTGLDWTGLDWTGLDWPPARR